MREWVEPDKYEYRATRDHRAPLVADDDDMHYGWQNISLPLTIDDGWKIWDTSSDKKTVWRRLKSKRCHICGSQRAACFSLNRANAYLGCSELKAHKPELFHPRGGS